MRCWWRGGELSVYLSPSLLQALPDHSGPLVQWPEDSPQGRQSFWDVLPEQNMFYMIGGCTSNINKVKAMLLDPGPVFPGQTTVKQAGPSSIKQNATITVWVLEHFFLEREREREKVKVSIWGYQPSVKLLVSLDDGKQLAKYYTVLSSVSCSNLIPQEQFSSAKLFEYAQLNRNTINSRFNGLVYYKHIQMSHYSENIKFVVLILQTSPDVLSFVLLRPLSSLTDHR